jgi:hypothetical protein
MTTPAKGFLNTLTKDVMLPFVCFSIFSWRWWLLLQGVVSKTFFIGIVGGGVQLGSLGTVATSGLLCPPRVIMMIETLVE